MRKVRMANETRPANHRSISSEQYNRMHAISCHPAPEHLNIFIIIVSFWQGHVEDMGKS
jgi:hypothetical protein